MIQGDDKAKATFQAATIDWRIEGGESAVGRAGERRRGVRRGGRSPQNSGAKCPRLSRGESKRTLKSPTCFVDAAEQQPVTPQFSTWT